MTIHEQLEQLSSDELREVGKQLSQLKERWGRLNATLKEPLQPTDWLEESALDCAEQRFDGCDLRQLIAQSSAKIEKMEAVTGV